jgi:TonB-dependent receptor
MMDRPAMARAAMLCTCALAALAAPTLAHAQTGFAASAAPVADESTLGIVEGVVTDAAGRFVNSAEVRIDNSSVVVRTDTEGRFRFTRVDAGTHTITVSYIGLPEYSEAITVQPAGTTRIDITMAASEGETITVSASRPIAESEAAALQLQRSSTALVAVVAADSIGRFPDQNIAAALSRLPGIAVQRDQGQERFVSLRGARNNWTTISFDGINVISPAGRTTRFDTIPSSIASAVVVRKAVTANMPGETIAGNIDIRTRGAFDYPGLRAAADLGLGFNELGGGRQYNASGFISDRFFNDTVGILLTASRYERNMVTDNFEGSWTLRPDGQVWNNGSQNKLYRLTRSNTAFGGRLDWRPSDGNEFFLNSVHTEFRDDELRSAYVFDFDDSRNGPGYANAAFGNTPLQGTIYGNEIDSTLNSSSSRQRIFTNTLGGNHEIDAWDVQWRLNYTLAQSDSRPPFQSTWRSPANVLQRPSLTYDLTDPTINRIRLYQTVRNPDGSYALGGERPFISTTELDYVTMTRNRQRDETNAYTARLDVTRDIGLIGDQTELRFGVQYDDRTKDSNQTVLEARAADLTAAGIPLPRMQDISIDGPFQGELPLGYSFR